MINRSKIPDATIERISRYARPLEDLLEKGYVVVSSEKLAEMCRVNPAQVRKDLSHFGEFGVRGVGYGVSDLLREIKRILLSDREWRMAIVGIGNLGMGLLKNENFLRRHYRFVAAFDSDPDKIGQELENGLIIRPVSEIKALVKDLGIEVAVITTSPSQAQSVAALLADAGISAILNCSPIQVRKPASCLVENLDFTVNLDNLAYHLSKTD